MYEMSMIFGGWYGLGCICNTNQLCCMEIMVLFFWTMLIGSKVFVYPIQSVIVKLCSVDLSPLLHFQENIEKTEKTCGTESIFVVLKIVVQFAKAIRR